VFDRLDVRFMFKCAHIIIVLIKLLEMKYYRRFDSSVVSGMRCLEWNKQKHSRTQEPYGEGACTVLGGSQTHGWVIDVAISRLSIDSASLAASSAHYVSHVQAINRRLQPPASRRGSIAAQTPNDDWYWHDALMLALYRVIQNIYSLISKSLLKFRY